MSRVTGRHSRIDLITVLIAVWMAFSSPVTAEQLYYRTVSPGSITIDDLTICAGDVESIIAGTGTLLPSGALPTDLVAVAASTQVQGSISSVWFNSDLDDSIFQGDFTDLQISLISTQGTVLEYEITSSGEILANDLNCFDSSGVQGYVSHFSYDTAAIGAPGGPSETVYPLLDITITVGGQVFEAQPGATVTVKNNAGQDFVKFSGDYVEVQPIDPAAQEIRIDVGYDTDAVGTPGQLNTTEYPVLLLQVSTDVQTFEVLPGAKLEVKDNAGQDLVRFSAPLAVTTPATSALVELTIAGSGSLLSSNAPPPVLTDVLASSEVQFTVARVWFLDVVGDRVQFDGTLTPGDMSVLTAIFTDGFESGATADWSTSIP